MLGAASRLGAPGAWSCGTCRTHVPLLSAPTPQYLARRGLLGSSVGMGALTVRMGLGYAIVTKTLEIQSDCGSWKPPKFIS